MCICFISSDTTVWVKIRHYDSVAMHASTKNINRAIQIQCWNPDDVTTFLSIPHIQDAAPEQKRQVSTNLDPVAELSQVRVEFSTQLPA